MTGRVLSTGQTVKAGEAGLGGSVVEHSGAAPGFVMPPPRRTPPAARQALPLPPAELHLHLLGKKHVKKLTWPAVVEFLG